MASTKVQRIMTQPINLIFRFLQSKARIQIWLFEQKDLRIEGRIIGFDEYMNLVLDDAEEVNVKKKSKKALGRILLKGDNITLMMNSCKGEGEADKRQTSISRLLVIKGNLSTRVWEERLDYERSQEKVVVAGGTHMGSGNHALLARLTIVFCLQLAI
ncbi:hypothetical protein Csa_019571 [Cucumis sativus]|nr:hypothetical protein Csa_019571 [Cucumis sativus]